MASCLVISVERVLSLPLARWSRVRPTVEVCVTELPPKSAARGSGSGHALHATYHFLNGAQDPQGDVAFTRGDFFVVDAEAKRDWSLSFTVGDCMSEDRRTTFVSAPIGYAEIEVWDLAREPLWHLVLQDVTTRNPIFGTDSWLEKFNRGWTSHAIRRPSFLVVRVQRGHFGARLRQLELPPPEASDAPRDRATSEGGSRRKRVMVVTRGTRGDVQPFLALARGLILPPHNCEVCIVTEICWKDLVKSARAGLPEGTLLFRPSGGDTTFQTRTAVSMLTTWHGQHYDILQALVMANQEANFFPSEGCCYHWAVEEKPDFIVFGFTTVHIAMVLSESLGIPIVGFILQPSRRIEGTGDLFLPLDGLRRPVQEVFRSPGFLAVLTQIFEGLGVAAGLSVNQLRRARGLAPCPKGYSDSMRHYDELARQGVPLIVPVCQKVLSERLVEELRGFRLTDFVFMRLGECDRLDAEVSDFIKAARGKGRKVFAVTFSSMPIGEAPILRLAVEALTSPVLQGDAGASSGPAMIAFVGGQEFDPPEAELLQETHLLHSQGRLLVMRRPQPFGALFPLLDAVIGQGGLGVTSEALLAGIPVITSGILLMDQRWWAARVNELGCGSRAVRIQRMLQQPGPDQPGRAVTLLQRALGYPGGQHACATSSAAASLGMAPSFQADWIDRAAWVGRMLRETRKNDPDGVAQNAAAVFEAGAGLERVTVTSAFADAHRGAVLCVCRQAHCCLRCIYLAIAWLVLHEFPAVVYFLLFCIADILCCGPCRRRCCCARRSRRARRSQAAGLVDGAAQDPGHVADGEVETPEDDDSPAS